MWQRPTQRETSTVNPAASTQATAPTDTSASKPAGAVPAPKPPSASPTPDPAKSGETKTHLLANEQAEAARSAALSGKIPDAPATRRYFKVRVRDAGTIEVGLPPANSVMIRLDGIKAHEADETCKTKEPRGPAAPRRVPRSQASFAIAPSPALCRLAPAQGFHDAMQRRGPGLGNAGGRGGGFSMKRQ
jgi:hypothetical protein